MSSSLKALRALVAPFSSNISESFFAEIEQVLLGGKPFLEKVKLFDTIVAKYPDLSVIDEYAFDLIMAFHIEEKHHIEDYFDTKEWMDIEDKTLERGTELLNILLYLSEAIDSEVDVELEDFLNEFLLIDEDEFQDEYKIYEGLITNVELVEEDADVIIETARRMDDIGPDLKDLFLPLLLFFKSPLKPIVSGDKLTPAELGLYGSLLAYYKG
jgi:hypothetical protein